MKCTPSTAWSNTSTNAAKHQIDVRPPDVNGGDTTFTVTDGKIQFGLVAVKNVGEGAVEAIVEERRENGPLCVSDRFLRTGRPA